MTTASSPWLESLRSGDVELFYRLFGEPGASPLLLLHGANYYDSHDWTRIADDLADGRQACAYDARGYGRSSWSPSQNYSLDAHLDDIERLLDHLGWQQTILVGHSRGGSFAPRDGGWVNVRRDPAFQSDRPTDRPEWKSALAPLDPWDALSGLVRRGVPALIIRAIRSASYDDEALLRLRNDFATIRIAEVDCGHDVPGAAPDALVAALRAFLRDKSL